MTLQVLLFSVFACRHAPAEVPAPSPAAQVARARGPDGDWEGRLQLPNAELRVVLHLVVEGEGLTATLDFLGESVETAEEAEILRQQGWAIGQGYLFGAPAPLT